MKVATVDQVNSIITPMMDKGLLHRHLHEDSTQEEMSLTYVPYWIVSVSARTSVIATDETAQIAQTATTAALMGVIFGGMGGGFGGGGRGVVSEEEDADALLKADLEQATRLQAFLG